MIIVVLFSLVLATIVSIRRLFVALADQDPVKAIFYVVVFIINGASLVYVITLFIEFFKIN